MRSAAAAVSLRAFLSLSLSLFPFGGQLIFGLGIVFTYMFRVLFFYFVIYIYIYTFSFDSCFPSLFLFLFFYRFVPSEISTAFSCCFLCTCVGLGFPLGGGIWRRRGEVGVAGDAATATPESGLRRGLVRQGGYSNKYPNTLMLY